jgi:hypothetical protein
MMTPARLRLALAVVLFLGWIAWLAYLAMPSVTPREVLSHSQFLISQLDVIARIDADAEGRPVSPIHVEEVHWPASAKDKVGQSLVVTNIKGMKDHGFAGPGLYIVPLIRDDDAFKVAPAPRSPGYDGGSHRFPRIYPATEQNRRQLAVIPKPAEK